MKSQGFHLYAIGAIEYDKADIARRQQRQDVVELAKSRKKLAINPLLLGPGGVLVAGRDRLAAELLNGSREVWCQVVADVTDRELLVLEVEENVRRRDIDRDQQLARLVDIVEQQKVREREANTVRPERNSKPGPKVTPRGEARAEVAVLAKTTPEAVRNAENRARAAEAPEPAEAPPIDDFDVGLPNGLADEVRAIQARVDALANHLQAVQSRLTQAIEGEPDSAEELVDGVLAKLAAMRDVAKELAAQIRATRPAALCPYGKGECWSDCNFCRGALYATADAMKMDLPPELLRRGAAAMVSDGEGGFQKYAKEITSGAMVTPASEKRSTIGDHLVRPGPLDGSAASNGAVAGSNPARVTKPKRHVHAQLDDGRTVDANDPPDDLRDPHEAA